MTSTTVATKRDERSGAPRGPGFFQAINPVTGLALEQSFPVSTMEEVEATARAAAAAAPAFAATSAKERAALLRSIADALTSDGEAIIARANLETGLPLPRLQGELARTTGQLRLFAEVVEEGSWVDARIDEALPDRKPVPRSDIRSMLRPLGPVAVFGASNFPLAFSVAGGDTASALAGGNPVVVKAHPAHPGTSQLVAKAVSAAVQQCGLHQDVFNVLFDAGIEVGQALVTHPAMQAIAFTGSTSGGRALMRLAADRPEPIPCFAEMGSTNPLFILPEAMQERGASLAQGLQSSFTLGSGQFCTKPGLVFVPRAGSDEFLSALQSGVAALGRHGMLTPGIASAYTKGVLQRAEGGTAERIAGQDQTPDSSAAATDAAVFSVSLEEFAVDKAYEEEIFGPTTLLVHYGQSDELLRAARALHGHLTATIHGTEQDLLGARELVTVLEAKVGRILFNGYPTGVEVCHAMVHGGPFPATSDSRSTSVGTRAMLRFVRPVCYQDCPDALLPPELRHGNPLGIERMTNGIVGRS